MKRVQFLIGILVIFCITGFISKVHAQSSPVLYFCESYGSNGEVGISDRYHTGYLTVMVINEKAMGLSNVYIEFDKYNCTSGSYVFYKKFNFTIKPSSKYVYFSKNSESDMSFDDPGIYRVFLLDSGGSTVASALIEIIP